MRFVRNFYDFLMICSWMIAGMIEKMRFRMIEPFRRQRTKLEGRESTFQLENSICSINSVFISVILGRNDQLFGSKFGILI